MSDKNSKGHALVLAITVFGALAIGIGQAHAITMTEFCINGDTIETSSIRFENCQIEFDIGSKPVDPDLITVTGLENGGLVFEAASDALSVAGGDSIDFAFNFVATAKTPLGVEFASLELTDFVVSGDGLIQIEDAIFDQDTLVNIGNLFVEADALFGNTLFDSVEFLPPPLAVIQQVSIFVDSGFFGSPAGISEFEVRKAVPEPAIVALFGIGLAGFSLVRRRRIAK